MATLSFPNWHDLGTFFVIFFDKCCKCVQVLQMCTSVANVYKCCKCVQVLQMCTSVANVYKC